MFCAKFIFQTRSSVNKVIEQYINNDTRYKFLYERVYIFPASLFKIKKADRAYRTNYAEMFSDVDFDKIFKQQVSWIKSNFTYKKVFHIMDEIVSPIDCLEGAFKRFYVEIVTLRYMCIVLRLEFKKSYDIVEGMCENDHKKRC